MTNVKCVYAIINQLYKEGLITTAHTIDEARDNYELAERVFLASEEAKT